MYMKDWTQKLDEFLRVSEREILTHTGKLECFKRPLNKAREEYVKYQQQFVGMASPVENHFFAALREVKQLGSK